MGAESLNGGALRLVEHTSFTVYAAELLLTKKAAKRLGRGRLLTNIGCGSIIFADTLYAFSSVKEQIK